MDIIFHPLKNTHLIIVVNVGNFSGLFKGMSSSVLTPILAQFFSSNRSFLPLIVLIFDLFPEKTS